MPQPISIRPARKSDREWCGRLMASTEPWVTLKRGLRESRAALRRPGTQLFVARAGGRRVGFILVDSYGFAGAPYIPSVAVEASERGRGIGSRLLAFAERLFARRRHLYLCVSSFNRDAQRLYRRLGYGRVGELRDHIVSGHSELLLHKRLG